MRAASSIVLLDFMRLKKKIFILQAVQQQHLHPGSPHRQSKPWLRPKSSKCAGTPLRRRPETCNRWFGTAAQCAPVVWVVLWKERRKCSERTEGRHEGNDVCLIFRDRFARIENDWVSHIPLSSIFLEVLNVNDYDFYHNEHEVN